MSQRSLFSSEHPAMRNELPSEAETRPRFSPDPNAPRNKAYWEGFNVFRNRGEEPTHKDPELQEAMRAGYRLAELSTVGRPGHVTNKFGDCQPKCGACARDKERLQHKEQLKALRPRAE